MAELAKLMEYLEHAPETLTESLRILRFELPDSEFISCVNFRGTFYISGIDIVKSLIYRLQLTSRKVLNLKKFEEGVFSDLRNLKPGLDCTLEPSHSDLLRFLHKNQCIRTQKKQKVFYWFSVPHTRMYNDALDRDIKREALGLECTTIKINENCEGHNSNSMNQSFFSKQYPEHCQETYHNNSNDLVSSPQTYSSYYFQPSLPHFDQQATMTSQYYPPSHQHSFSDSYMYMSTDTLNGFADGNLSQLTTPDLIDNGFDPCSQGFDMDQWYTANHELRTPPFALQNRNIWLGSEQNNKSINKHACEMELMNMNYNYNQSFDQNHASFNHAKASSLESDTSSSNTNPSSYTPFLNFKLNSSPFDPETHVLVPVDEQYQELSSGGYDFFGSVHSSQADKVYNCQFQHCGKSFKRREHLRRHVRAHTGIKPYHCPAQGCDKGFARRDNLGQHFKVHKN